MVDPSDPGTFVETEVRRAIAELGVADFVYLPPKPAQGESNQEVGDALLVANGRSGMLEVKARHPDIGASEDVDLWDRLVEVKYLSAGADRKAGTYCLTV